MAKYWTNYLATLSVRQIVETVTPRLDVEKKIDDFFDQKIVSSNV